MGDGVSVFPKIESGFGFKPHMIVAYVEAFKNQTLNKKKEMKVLSQKKII